MTEATAKPLVVSNECRNCKMRFDSSEALANHVKKFCQDSAYGDVNKLEMRLQALGNNKAIVQNPNLNFQDVRNFLKGDAANVSAEAQQTLKKMNLDDLRNYFHSDNEIFEELSKQALRAKERELKDEVEEFKREKNELRLARLEQDRQLEDLMKELEMRRDREMRARIEKNQIQHALQEVQKNKITAQERDKRRELERLAAEREALALKEEQVIQDIRDLEAKMAHKEEQIRLDKQRMIDKLTDINNPHKNTQRYREMQLAKERGEMIANIQNRRDTLEKDRVRIMDDLQKVKSGDMQALRKNEASRWAANDIIQRNPVGGIDLDRVKLDPAIKDKFLHDQLRIKQLKEQRDQTLKEMMPEHRDLDPLTREMDFYAARTQDIIPAAPRTIPNSPLKSPAINKQFQQPQKSNRVTFQTENLDMVEKLKKLREDYARTGEADPEFFSYLNDLENHIVRKEPLTKPQPQPVRQSVPHFFDPPKKADPPQMPLINPFMMPPPMIPPIQLPPLQLPQYIPPPPPVENTKNIEQLLQSLKPEPLPVAAQQYYQPQVASARKTEEIERMNKLIEEQTMQNTLMERELFNIKTGAATFDQFEKLLQDPLSIELEVQKKKVLGASLPNHRSKILPDDFRFRQNDYRAEDMEVEERALMNIAASEFDELRILSKLPKGSEIYKHKMQQYKEMSAMRAEMEKILQEQKFEKIRREFERQKIEDERRYTHEQWLEEQQKLLLEAKLQMAAQAIPEDDIYEQQPFLQPEPPYYEQQYSPIQQQEIQPPAYQPPPAYVQTQPPSPRQKTVKSIRDQGTAITPALSQKQIVMPPTPIQKPPPVNQTMANEFSGDPETYSPQRGFNMYFDFIARIARQYRSMRLVYAVYNVSRPLFTPALIDIHDGEPDPEDPNEKNRIIFREFAAIKNIQPHPSSNLIIEIQVPKPNTGTQNKFISFGWTLLNLFDSGYNFNRGIFKLPIYMSPTKTDIDIRDITQLQRIPETVLLFRIGNPDDQFSKFQYTPMTVPEDYQIPRIHQFATHQQPGFGEISTLDAEIEPEIVVINPQYQCKGIRVYLHFMKYYVPALNARIQLTLYNGANIIQMEDQKMCNWISNKFDRNNLLITQPTNPMNQGFGITPMEITRAEVTEISDETTWLQDFYKLQFNQSGVKDTNDINLLVQIMEAKPKSLGQIDQKQDYQCIAYGFLKVNNPDGTIKFGAQDVPLFKPPVSFLRKNASDLVKPVIKITVGQPQAQAAQKPQQPAQENNAGLPNIQDPELPNKEPAFQQMSDKPFIPNTVSQVTSTPFKEGEGLDIYIDGGRFLPENVTFSRVIMRAFTVDQIRVIDPVKGTCDINLSSARNPFYGFRYELRAPKLDPTIVIEATIETIDRADSLEKIVGYAYLPLFLNATSRKVNTDRNLSNVIVQNGNYQVPIFIDKLPAGKQITYENLQTIERIPCATLLIRVAKAPMEGAKVLGLQVTQMQEWKTKGIIIDPPEYSEGKYNNQYCQVSQKENEIYNIKGQRNDPSMREVTAYLMKLKGKNEQLSDDELARWLDRLIVTNQSTPKINMKYFSAYVQKLGFRFSVERLHGLTQKLPHIVVSSIVPPGSLYLTPPKLTPDVAIFAQYSMETHWSSLQFNDDIKNFSGLPMAYKLGFALDVKAIQYTSATEVTTIDVGWTFLPIFSILGNEDGTQSIYINSGLYMLPLFIGALPKDIIGVINQNQDNIINKLQPDKNTKVIEFASVIVRIHDNQRDFLPSKGQYQDINYQYINKEKLAKFAFDPKFNQATGADNAKSVTPISMQTREGFMKAANLALQIAFSQ